MIEDLGLHALVAAFQARDLLAGLEVRGDDLRHVVGGQLGVPDALG